MSIALVLITRQIVRIAVASPWMLSISWSLILVVTVMEDRVAEEDGNHGENVSDLAETSSTQAISIESDSSTRSRTSTVSLLSVLIAPDMSELSR